MSIWSFKNSKKWGKKYDKCSLDNQSPININTDNISECYLLCLLKLNYKKSIINCKLHKKK